MIYIIAIIIVFYLAITYQRTNILSQKNLIFFLASLVLILLLSLRDVSVGGDTIEYCKFFQGKFSSTYGRLNDTSVEIGFVKFCEALRIVSKSSFVFIFATSLMTLVPFIVYANKYSNNRVLSILYVLASNHALLLINLETNLRQCVSTGFLIWALYLLHGLKEYKRKHISFIFIILLLTFAILNHTSQFLIILIILVLHFIKFNKLISYISVIVALIISVYFVNVFENIFIYLISLLSGFDDLSNITRYVSDSSSYKMSGIAANLVKQLPLASLMLYTISKSTYNEMQTISYKSFIVSYFIITISLSFPLGFRMVFPLQLLGCVHVPQIFMKNPKSFYINLMFYIFFTMRLFLSVINTNNYNLDNHFLPYKFIFE